MKSVLVKTGVAIVLPVKIVPVKIAHVVTTAMIAARVAAVIGIVDPLLIEVVNVIAGPRRIAVEIVTVDRLPTGAATVTNGIVLPPATEGVIEIADRLPTGVLTGIVALPLIAAVTVATTVTGDQPRPAIVIADRLLTGAATGIAVGTVTEAQIVEMIAVPQTADVTATIASHNG